jgi:hypothetical protein
MNPKLQNILAIVIGWITIVALGALLFPILTLCLDNNVEATFEKGIKINYFSISTCESFFVAITTFFGGFVTCWIAKGRKMFFCTTSSLVLFFILTVLGICTGGFSILNIIKLLLIIPFMIMGGLIRKLVENNKHD